MNGPSYHIRSLAKRLSRYALDLLSDL